MASNRLNCKHNRVQSVVHREGLNRHVYFTCPSCGQEWTETQTVADLSDVVTTDEIIEAHEQLETGKSFRELVE